MNWTLSLIAASVVVSPLFAGQMFATAEAYKALISARSLKCSFPWYASVDFDSDQPKVKTGQQNFEFHIDGVDLRAGKARIIGNAGAEDLVAFRGEDALSFVERVPAGIVHVTTVYAWRDTQKRFKATHSRHTAISGPSPSQGYGYCQTW